MATALTREQNSYEIVVQLGNVVEAIQSATQEIVRKLNNKIDSLQAQLASVASALAALQQQLEAQQLNAQLQTELARIHEGDITPDNIQEVMSHLGIEHD